MKQKSALTVLCIAIALLAAAAAWTGLFSGGGPGPYMHTSIRGAAVPIWGKGLYRDMSAEVAPQGIAQDAVTLFAGVPALLLALWLARRGGLKGRLFLAGVLGYFLVTYLFYLVMGMYNALFLAYAALCGCSFYAFLICLRPLRPVQVAAGFGPGMPVRVVGGFLMFNAIAIAFLWLGVVVPPLLDGTVIPPETEHYTTLIVQGLDLGILLPASFLSGILLARRRPMGYLLAPVYLVFLSLLMAALTAKVVAMAMLGSNVVPAIFIIPAFTVAATLCAWTAFRHLSDQPVPA